MHPNLKTINQTALEALFRLQGWSMDRECLDELMRGGTIYNVPPYDGDYVEVYRLLTELPAPKDEGWGVLAWRGRVLMRTSQGLYGTTLKDGHWAWSPCAHQIIDWASS